LEAYAGAVASGLYLARPNDLRPFSTHAGNSSGNNSWETPADLAEALSAAVGGFDLDPCAATSDRRKARVKAKILLTEADDGLSVPWRGRCFVNQFIAGHADVFMIRGRLKFGEGQNSAPFPSCVVVWGAGPDLINRLSVAMPDAWHVPRPKPMLVEDSAPPLLETA
jgi:hypothetical protein